MLGQLCARRSVASDQVVSVGLCPTRQGKNWSASNGTFSNGKGQTINNPGAYFSAVASNAHGYNSADYANGHGTPISNPSAYYKAVSRCVRWGACSSRAGGSHTVLLGGHAQALRR